MSFQKVSGDVGIERSTTSPARSRTDSAATCAIPCESSPCLACGVRTAIVERCDLDVLDIVATVGPLVFKAEIGKVNVAVEVRQIVLLGPLFDLFRIAVRTAVGVRMIAVAIVEELLVLALQLVVEHHAINPYVVLLKPVCGPDVGGVKLSVVRQFPRTRISRIERLPRLVFWCAVTLEQVASPVGEGHQHRAPVLVTVERSNGPNQLRGPKPVEVAVPQIARAPPVVEQFVDRNDAEGADRGQSPHVGSAQLERVSVKENSFPFPSTRQVQALAEHVARVDR